MSIRQCDRCTAPRKSGGRCSRKTCKVGPMCWQHTRLLAGLAVRKSNVPDGGEGLFAYKDFPARALLALYTGERLTKAQLDRRYPGDTLAPYALELGPDLYVDARATNSGPARYANQCRAADRRSGHCAGNNARLRRDALRSGSHRIRAGSEIFANYGTNYWRDPHHYPSTSSKPTPPKPSGRRTVDRNRTVGVRAGLGSKPQGQSKRQSTTVGSKPKTNPIGSKGK